MTVELRIYVQDHGFLITDHDVSTPFEAMDYSTGLAGVMESAALVSAGVDRGYVTVIAQPVADRPALDTPDQWSDLAAWDDVAEFSVFVPHGSLTVAQLEYPPTETPQLPDLSPDGPGHYRVRIHASGRDRHFDQVVGESGERFLVVAWPAPPAAALVIKASSRCGYGLRLAALESPPDIGPIQPTVDEQAEAAHEAALRRNLLGM
ncbi:hypothetical protein SAMN05444365_107131 [Micromonospora pattaloongensis]|uniref:Uncharacterized protein n=1 Tax=Micromonospora pattaloongensis TaxID=405436 RepID=A0A1H3R8P2_9ACTN|nr:hypothetical protein [Micromonospora pattaloongensis]SDZ21873.1 hypothetical protein SAMN05444365_107131 [Micromonospora pattaloongensis]